MQIKNLLLPKSAGQRAGQQEASASLSQQWRPQAGVCGVTAYGYFDFFGLMPCDVAKDANMEATMISRCLDLLHDHCTKKGHAVPQTLIIAADNTCRESKNQFFMAFVAYLKCTRRFSTIQVEYLQSGHTHAEQDRRDSNPGDLKLELWAMKSGTGY